MIRKYINTVLTILVIILFVWGNYLHFNNQKLESALFLLKSNEKAFMAESDKLKSQNRAFQFTIGQLEYFNDSLIIKMNEVRKGLRIKDGDLRQMQYLLSEAEKKDTIVFRDTLFRESTLDIDTLIGDKWYQMKLGLKYPSIITTDPKFVSEKYIMVDYKKETINLPKKCWLLRLFQKKHKVVEVNVVEKNPYIENKQQKFIEIVE